jgi:hypothetical protein
LANYIRSGLCKAEYVSTEPAILQIQDDFVDIDDMLLDELDLSGVQAAIPSNIERPVQLSLELPAENGDARRVRQPPKRPQVTTTEDTRFTDEELGTSNIETHVQLLLELPTENRAVRRSPYHGPRAYSRGSEIGQRRGRKGLGGVNPCSGTGCSEIVYLSSSSWPVKNTATSSLH